jgi:hypothetical protein
MRPIVFVTEPHEITRPESSNARIEAGRVPP